MEKNIYYSDECINSDVSARWWWCVCVFYRGEHYIMTFYILCSFEHQKLLLLRLREIIVEIQVNGRIVIVLLNGQTRKLLRFVWDAVLFECFVHVKRNKVTVEEGLYFVYVL